MPIEKRGDSIKIVKTSKNLEELKQGIEKKSKKKDKGKKEKNEEEEVRL